MAYQFNGTNQYMSCNAPMTGEPMTMASWIQTTSATATNRRALFLGETTSTQRRGFNIGITENFTAVDIGASAAPSSAIGTAVPNVWFHGCGVFVSATSRTAYFNGVAGTTNTVNRGTQNSPNELTIGVGRGGGGVLGLYTPALFAEVGIWNVILTSAEIASLAKGMTCDKIRPQNLVFYAPLIRNLQDTKGGLIITPNNGPIVAAHPRIYK